MPKIKYVDIKIGLDRLATIAKANEIIDEYAGQGFDLTLRQLYYQFVSRGLIPNSQKEYKKLGDVVNDGRLAGLIDWDRITDRTRNLRSLSTWSTPGSIVSSAAASYRRDLWASQRHRVEVWIEKDALTGVIEGICEELRVPFFSCRGYTSQSEMWAAAQRLLKYASKPRCQEPVILHLGDHDPSGIDMSRDIEDRLNLFTWGAALTFKRLALNMPQVEEYQPPPNPAKLTDSRCAGYMQVHGDESWELDALEPSVIVGLIRDAVETLRDQNAWDEAEQEEDSERDGLREASDRWPEVVEFLQEGGAGG